MEIKITPKNILLAKCVKYQGEENGYLTQKPLSQNEEYRVVLMIGSKIIDFQEADDLTFVTRNARGEIDCPIDADTYYIEEVYEYTQLNDKEINYVPTLLGLYQEKKLAEKDGKLLKFPKCPLN